MTEKYKLKNTVTHLCKIADEIIRDNVLKVFNFKNKKKGARQIKMVLENEFDINYNLKRIRRSSTYSVQLGKLTSIDE